MNKPDEVIDRIGGEEFSAWADQITNDIMAIIRQTLVAQEIPTMHNDEWESIYMPALRQRVFGQLATRLAVEKLGWHTVFCNALRALEDPSA